jgi:hypothetical protein
MQNSKIACVTAVCAAVLAPVDVFAAPSILAALPQAGQNAFVAQVSCRRQDGYLNSWAAPNCIPRPPRHAVAFNYYPSYWCPAYTVPGCYYPGYISAPW